MKTNKNKGVRPTRKAHTDVVQKPAQQDAPAPQTRERPLPTAGSDAELRSAFDDLIASRNEIAAAQERLESMAELIVRRMDESEVSNVRIGPHSVVIEREKAGGVRSISLLVNGAACWRREIVSATLPWRLR